MKGSWEGKKVHLSDIQGIFFKEMDVTVDTSIFLPQKAEMVVPVPCILMPLDVFFCLLEMMLSYHPKHPQVLRPLVLYSAFFPLQCITGGTLPCTVCR